MARSPINRASAIYAGCVWWLLLLTAAWVYWPALSGPALLDDHINLAPLRSLSDNTGYFWQLVWENRSGPLGRPISMVSFGLEFLFSGGDLWVAKYINLLLHLVNGCLVFWLMLLLVEREAGFANDSTMTLAIIVAGVWLLNPFFVSTTAYIVQRMTILSTLGVLVGCLIYVKARISCGLFSAKAVLATITWTGALLFGAFSKESGLLLIPITAVLEIYLSSTARPEGLSRQYRRNILLMLIIGLLVMILLAIRTSNGFLHRDFDLTQRLLTEARIVWEYAFHYFLPFDRGMGLYHDDQVVSRSMFSPWTTPVALLSLLALLAFLVSALWSRTWALVALGVGFYIVGHLMESTIVPLELYFEHRNYLAAIGLSILVLGVAIRLGAGAIGILPLAALGSVWMLILLVPLSYQTSVWSDRYLFGLNAVNHHPRSPRANLEWARILAERSQLSLALEYVGYAMQARAHQASRPTQDAPDPEIYMLIMHCISQAEPDRRALQALVDRWRYHDHGASLALEVLLNELRQDRCSPSFSVAISDALWQISTGQPVNHFDPRTLANIARFENDRENYERTLEYAKAWSSRRPAEPKALLMLAFSYANLADWVQFLATIQHLRKLNVEGELGSMDKLSLEVLEQVRPQFDGVSE